jgi:hypothetical protein
MTVAAGASASLVLRPPEAVVGSDAGGSSRTGTLTVTTNELTGRTHQVSLSSTVVGANLRLLDATGAPTTSVTFNTTQRCPSPTTIFVQNTGNAPASVAIANTNFHLFQWSAFAPSPIIPGGSAVSHALGVFTENDNGACNGAVTVQYTATGALCTLMPLDLQASFNIAGSGSCFCS